MFEAGRKGITKSTIEVDISFRLCNCTIRRNMIHKHKIDSILASKKFLIGDTEPIAQS